MSFVRNLLAERRRRAMGTIMRHLETELWPQLDAKQRHAVRSVVLGAINEYHDSVLDIVKAAAGDGSEVNEEALALIARVGGQLAEFRRSTSS